MDGWIKLHRIITDWKWYDDSNTFRLFVHCLLKANSTDNEWHGLIIKRGDFFTSVSHLSEELRLTHKQIRISLDKLKGTSEVTTKGANKGTMITICKYDDYQLCLKTKGRTKGRTKGQNKGNNKEEEEINTNVFIYSNFYDGQIELSENNKDYIRFVKYLFGENKEGIKLEGVLSIKKQLSFEKFEILKEMARVHNKKILTIISGIENDEKYYKNKRILSTTIENWITDKFIK